jgi:hypothetical protein
MFDILWFLAGLVSLIAGDEPLLAPTVPNFSSWATMALACLPVYCTGRALASVFVTAGNHRRPGPRWA